MAFSQHALIAQNTPVPISLTLQTALGVSVPNHPRFTPITAPSLYSALVLGLDTHERRWGAAIGSPTLRLAVSRQSLGNAKVLGNAYGIVPSLQFLVLQRPKIQFLVGAGLGLAYMDKPYRQNTNEANTVVGSAVSFFGAADCNLQYRLSDRFRAGTGVLITHYSNGNYELPNLGVNTVSICLSVTYDIFNYPKNNSNNNNNEPLAPASNPSTKIQLFTRGSYGLTERSIDGPKYPVYVLGVGASRRIGVAHRFTAGAEYIYNLSPYEFMVHTGQVSHEEARVLSRRGVLFVGHELLLGHIGFLTEGGVYLNKHYNQHSWISTKIGFNFYAQHQQKHSRFQPYLGTYIRAYFGEAEFVELAGGFLF